MPPEIGAVVLAGGFGTRVRHILGDLPKPLAPVCGYPFLHWVLRFLAGQGITRIALATHFNAEKIESFVAAFGDARLRISCVREDSPLGTAGAFLNAAQVMQPPPAGYLVMNGDSLALTPLADLTNAGLSPGASGALFARHVVDASRYGRVLTDDASRLLEFAEKRPGSGLVNAGIYVFPRETLDAFPSQQPLSFEYDVFPGLIAAGRRILVTNAEVPFIDIGTEASLAEAEAFIEANRSWF